MEAQFRVIAPYCIRTSPLAPAPATSREPGRNYNFLALKRRQNVSHAYFFAVFCCLLPSGKNTLAKCRVSVGLRSAPQVAYSLRFHSVHELLLLTRRRAGSRFSILRFGITYALIVNVLSHGSLRQAPAPEEQGVKSPMEYLKLS